MEGFMDLFKRKKRPSFLADQTNEAVGYQEVVDYLTEMNQGDYTKLLKVVDTYRKADKEVRRILKLETLAPVITKGEDFLSDDTDTELGNFLDDEPVKPKRKKAK